ncbi:MAG: ArgE/DapE family deacylase, partial [bacterium]|nr:ArgE/DapE family deacylase [bacterium]MDW8163663.1 ArgE/DapE family deacylase [Candidatus Omnitrophota bacterium]
EEEIQNFIYEKFKKFGECKLVNINEKIKEDPEYTFSDKVPDYSKRKNLVLEIGEGNGYSLILNTHSDIVPALNWKEAFIPEEKDGYLYGRGACDAKGQIATIYLILLAIEKMNIKIPGKLIIEIVIEEEIGGNGTLSLIRDGYKGDGVIVLEPTELKITPANRGAIWFKLQLYGKSVHMGKIWEGVNAIEKFCYLYPKFKEFEKKLIEESKNVPLFEKFKQPVQLNFGVIKGDGWPSMVCGKVEVEGGIGFLPNKELEQIKREFEDVIKNCGDEWIVSNYDLSFPKLHNDSYSISTDHILVKTMEKSSEESGIIPVVEGFIASCDARLFNKVGKMPVIVFGPGLLDDAHSDHEKIKLEDIKKASEILLRTILNLMEVKND